ncbi:MAG: hypothetical protein V9E93_16675 [Steroidobacteraceae bacterium]
MSRCIVVAMVAVTITWRRVHVGGRGGDAERVAHGPGRPREGRGVLHVEPLGDERRAQPERLRLAHLGDEGSGIGRVAGERVEAELGELVHGAAAYAPG